MWGSLPTGTEAPALASSLQLFLLSQHHPALTTIEKLAKAFKVRVEELWQRLLGRPVSDNGPFCQGAGGHAGGHRCRRAFMLTCMKRLAVSSRGVSLLVLGAQSRC